MVSFSGLPWGRECTEGRKETCAQAPPSSRAVDSELRECGTREGAWPLGTAQADRDVAWREEHSEAMHGRVWMCSGESQVC